MSVGGNVRLKVQNKVRYICEFKKNSCQYDENGWLMYGHHYCGLHFQW